MASGQRLADAWLVLAKPGRRVGRNAASSAGDIGTSVWATPDPVCEEDGWGDEDVAPAGAAFRVGVGKTAPSMAHAPKVITETEPATMTRRRPADDGGCGGGGGEGFGAWRGTEVCAPAPAVCDGPGAMAAEP